MVPGGPEGIVQAPGAMIVRGSFTLNLAAALGLALAAAVILAPFAAMVPLTVGLRFPFPRIFDRTVMVTLAAALLLFAQRLELFELVRRGFADARRNWPQSIGGLAVALAAIAALFTLAAAVSGHLRSPAVFLWSALHYIPAALLIALLEESFFRAFLLGGLENEFGSAAALIASSIIFAVVHVVRSPARFYLSGFHPAAGAEDLAASAARLGHAAGLLATIVGLFLLGLVLGVAFILTRRVYCSIGLHVGFVLGAKTWRHAIRGAIPRWIAGAGPVPLIAAPAAWLVSLIILGLMPRWLKSAERGTARQSYTGGIPRGRVR